MKIIIGIIITILLATTLAFAKNPPKEVQIAFAQKFPNAIKTKWGKENKHEWEAEFFIKLTKMSANFSVEGAWLETETEIPVSDFPKKVADAIKNKFPGWEIIGADKIENKKKGIRYEAEIKSGLRNKEVILKEDGTFAE